MARAADADDTRMKEGGTDRGAALMTSGAFYARSVPVSHFGDDKIRRVAHAGGERSSRREG
jgi:hypothetical protein